MEPTWWWRTICGAILAGEGDLFYDDAGEIEGYVKAELIPLAVASNSRLAQFPDVPTMKELGLQRSSWLFCRDLRLVSQLIW